MKIRNKNTKKYLPFVVALILLVVGASLFYVNRADRESASDPETTSEEITAQPDFSTGNDQDKKPDNNGNDSEGQAMVVDREGEQTSDTSQSITSDTGEITVYLPRRNSLVTGSQELSGISKLGTVSYRINDSVSGMIASGNLKVVNGRFSGVVDISTNASEGKIDIFGVMPDGNEYSYISIPVKFQQ